MNEIINRVHFVEFKSRYLRFEFLIDLIIIKTLQHLICEKVNFKQ